MLLVCLEKYKKSGVSKKACGCSKFLGERLFFDTSSSSTNMFEGKKNGLLVMEKALILNRVIFKERLELKNMMLGLIIDLKTKYGIQVMYA